MKRSSFVVLAAALASPAAIAHSAPSAQQYANLRAGASSTSRRPVLCLEASPIQRVGVEACGSGAGLLHSDASPEIARVRGKVNFNAARTRWGWIQPQLSAGVAELQVDGDPEAGLDFEGTGARGVDTAGPEVAASARVLYPLESGFELVGTLDLSMAYFAHAAELATPQRSVQPGVSLTFGVGF